jgi:branched-chain amino acid aminotransferase
MAFLFHFCAMKFICFNGDIILQQPLFTSENRGFRYGDGVFETIKVFKGTILLDQYHFDRLFLSLSLLKIFLTPDLNATTLENYILELCGANECLDSARVRLAVFRREEGHASFVIEASPLDEKANELNVKGWKINIFPDARKSCDAFANLKSANYLPYVLADLYAKESGCEESVVLNTENNLCDASKANIFLLIKNEVHTPALHQGCVNGVKRRFIIEELKKAGMAVYQHTVDETFLLAADEVFLTNAINDMRWVEAFKQKTYGNSFVIEFYKRTFSATYH